MSDAMSPQEIVEARKSIRESRIAWYVEQINKELMTHIKSTPGDYPQYVFHREHELIYDVAEIFRNKGWNVSIHDTTRHYLEFREGEG